MNGRRSQRPRVLVIAYACEPERGSEPGAGWGMVRAVSAFADCVVLVGPEHTAGIRQWQSEHASAGLSFLEVPEPKWARSFAARHRLEWFLIYREWLRRAVRLGEQLHQEQPFDVIYHPTYSAYWLPSSAVAIRAPVVWGPVGGAVVTPLRLWPLLGWRGIVEELLDLLAVRAFARLPSTRQSWSRVSRLLVQNRSTLSRLPGPCAAKAELLNHALFATVPRIPDRREKVGLLAAGRLESRKGYRLALSALATTPDDVTLTILGDGPQRRELERLSRRLGVAARVRFLGNLPRDRALEMMAAASAMVFTGLREEGGLALAEAMMLGIPVIVFGNGGAAEIAELAIDPTRVVIVPPGTMGEMSEKLGSAMTTFSRQPPPRSGPNLDQRAAEKRLRAVFDRVFAATRKVPEPSASSA